MTPLKAIRLKCLDCSGTSVKEVRLCHLWDCSLWAYRRGKRPETLRKDPNLRKLLDVDFVRQEQVKALTAEGFSESRAEVLVPSAENLKNPNLGRDSSRESGRVDSQDHEPT